MRADRPCLRRVCAFIPVLALCAFAATARAQAPSFVAPPRTIADIAAILEQEKPDPQRFAKLNASADAQPPADADKQALVKFYYDRADARSTLGRVREAIGDLEKTIQYAREEHLDSLLSRSEILLGFVYGWAGDSKHSLDVFRNVKIPANIEGAAPGFVVTRWIGTNFLQLGDLDQAELVFKKNEAAIKKAQERSA